MTLTAGDCRAFIATQLFTPALPSPPESHLPGRIGVELESFPFKPGTRTDARPMPVSLYAGEKPLVDLLAAASSPFGGIAGPAYAVQQSGEVPSRIDRITFPDGDRILFEPGGQVEISTAPCDSLTELQHHLESKRSLLGNVTEQHGIHFSQSGTNPWFNAAEINNQLDFPRYRAMQRYFDGIGPHGRQMMKLTSGMHINLDLGDAVDTRVRRVVAANLLVPFATGLFAHSPRISGHATGHKAYRSYIWQQADPTRTGILPMQVVTSSMRADDLIEAYLNFALRAPVVFIPALGDAIVPRELTFADWMREPIAGIRPDITHFAYHLTLLFPEVRLRGYLELRTVDAPPAEQELVPVLFYAGLLYNDKALEEALDMLVPFIPTINDLWRKSTHGLNDDSIYLPVRRLSALAIDGLASLGPEFVSRHHLDLFIRHHETYVLQRRSFADA